MLGTWIEKELQVCKLCKDGLIEGGRRTVALYEGSAPLPRKPCPRTTAIAT